MIDVEALGACFMERPDDHRHGLEGVEELESGCRRNSHRLQHEDRVRPKRGPFPGHVTRLSCVRRVSDREDVYLPSECLGGTLGEVKSIDPEFMTDTVLPERPIWRNHSDSRAIQRQVGERSDISVVGHGRWMVSYRLQTLPVSLSQRRYVVATPEIKFDEILGRRVRLGTWEDQKISTYRKIMEALDAREWDDAAKLGAYFIDEANVCFSIYRQWLPDLNAFLADQGVDAKLIEARNAQVTTLNKLPDGSAWDRNRQWNRFITAMEAFTAATYREDRELAKERMAEAKELWRQCHDRDVDHTYALMSLVNEELGEDAIRPMYDRVLLPLFAWRYEKFDIDKYPWDEGLEALMRVAFEAMRGHLVGPERTGDFEFEEKEDRYILRFDPCGSGHRTLRGDIIEGTPPRMEPPYNWTVSNEPHTWNHSTPGMCLYCIHCIVLMEEMPMERFGYPVRVIDPPLYGNAKVTKCQWQMFKDPTKVPAEYYERVGRTKPTVFGSGATGAPKLDVNTTSYPGAG